MRLQRLDGDETSRPVGAAVIRSLPAGDFALELGAADGPPAFRLTLSRREAIQLVDATQTVLHDGGEEVLITDD